MAADDFEVSHGALARLFNALPTDLKEQLRRRAFDQRTGVLTATLDHFEEQADQSAAPSDPTSPTEAPHMNDFDPINAAAEIDRLRASNALLLDLVERLRSHVTGELPDDLGADIDKIGGEDGQASELNLEHLTEVIEAAVRGDQAAASAARAITALLAQAGPERLSTLKLQALLSDPIELRTLAQREQRGTYRVYAERQGITGGSFQIDAAGPATAVVQALDGLGFTPNEIVHVEIDAA